MSHPLLTANRVAKQYTVNLKRTTILTNISFTVAAGEVVSLIGLNGAGKSTLLKLLAGINTPSRGTITLNGLPVSHPRARGQLGFMPENPQFYPDLSGWDFMVLSGQLGGLTKATARQRARALLADMGLTEAAHQPTRTYSKGMRGRLGFAQALIGQPQLLLLDEPLDGLDPLGRHQLKGRIQKLKRAGVTIIVCSHILSDLASFSDRIGVIHRGRLTTIQSTNVFTARHNLETAFLSYLKSL